METRRRRGSNKEKAAQGNSTSDTEPCPDRNGGGEALNPFCVSIKLENPEDGSPPPKSVWTNEVIPQALKPFCQDIASVTEAYILDRGEALIFAGHRNRNQGWSEDEARTLVDRLRGDIPWVGNDLEIRSRALTLQVGLNRIQQSVKDKRREKLKETRKARAAPGRRNLRRHQDESGDESDDSQASSRSTMSSRSRTSRTSSHRGEHSESGASGRSSSTHSYHSQEKDPHHGKIELPVFNGDDGSDPSSVSYRTWRFDVEIFRMNDCKEKELLPRVILSLRGQPGEMIRALGTNSTLEQVLSVLDGYYGDVLTADGLVQELYSISQRSGETASNFGMRIERVVAVISRLFPEEIPPETKGIKIRERFFAGLKAEYKRALKFLKKQPGCTYQDLLSEAREMDEEAGKETPHKPPPTKDYKTRPWQPFPTRKPAGFSPMTKSLKADILELRDAMMGDPDATQGEEDASQPEQEHDDPEVTQAIHAMMGAIHDAQPKNPYDRYRDKDRKPGPARDPSRRFQCLNCGGWNHLARNCPSPKLPRESKNGPKEGDKTSSPPQAQTGSQPQVGTHVSVVDTKEAYWEIPLLEENHQ